MVNSQEVYLQQIYMGATRTTSTKVVLVNIMVLELLEHMKLKVTLCQLPILQAIVPKIQT